MSAEEHYDFPMAGESIYRCITINPPLTRRKWRWTERCED